MVLLENYLKNKEKKMGGSKPAPDPMVQIKAQMKAQEDARLEQERKRGLDAERFLNENRITDDFRQNIYGQANALEMCNQVF